ncbi:MAG: methionyl-tRNA formyltransferase [Pseudonocardiales bacterium]|nr:methionyl-tRNA formyltransferase [Pseudonocardiales bacterium]
MRLLFAGTPEVAVPSLLALIASPRHEVIGVLTRPDAPAGRGRRVARSPVALAADEHGIGVYTPKRPREPDFIETLTELAPDCAPVVAYGALLPAEVLYIPRFGWINLHFSILPAWRGAAPVQHAVLAGDEITGASTFLIEEGLDTGPVFGVTTEAVRPDDTSGALLERLAKAGAGLLTATLDALEDRQIAPRDQSEEGVSFAPKLTVDDARIDFASAAAAIDRRIRACTPSPGAWTMFRGERVKLGPVRITALPAGELAPGELRLESGSVTVGTATRPIALGTVQPAGKKPMPAADWARGARIGPVDRLG